MKELKLALGSAEEVAPRAALLAITQATTDCLEMRMLERVVPDEDHKDADNPLLADDPYELAVPSPWVSIGTVAITGLLSHTGWLRRLFYARLVDVVDSCYDTFPEMRELLSPRFVYSLVSLSDLSLLKVCDEICQILVRSWAGSLTTPNMEVFDGINEKYCVQTLYYAARLDFKLDRNRAMQQRSVYSIAAFLLRTELVEPKEDYDAFLRRNTAAAAQRRPTPALRAAFKRLAGDSFDGSVWDGFAPSHGPGSVAYVTTTTRNNETYRGYRSGRLSLQEKDEQLNKSGWLCSLINAGVIPAPEWLKFSLPSRAYQSLQCPGAVDIRARHPMLLTCVPKTWKSKRLIGAEFCPRMWVQQGIRRGLEAAVEQSLFAKYVRFDSIERNIALARDLQQVTIDLSAASDSISKQFIASLFEDLPITQRMLRYARPSNCFVRSEDGELSVELNIFALMGNAITFPVMCMVFASIVEEAIQLYVCEIRFRFGSRITKSIAKRWANELRRHSAVFGDDIVCPKPVSKIVIRLLGRYGFVVNPNKTFIAGSYRESCGAEYVNGIDVRPLRLPRAFLATKDARSSVGSYETLSLPKRNEDKADVISSIESLLRRLSKTSDDFEQESPWLAITLCRLEHYLSVATETPTRELVKLLSDRESYRAFGAFSFQQAFSDEISLMYRMVKIRQRATLINCVEFISHDKLMKLHTVVGEYGDHLIVDGLDGVDACGLPRRVWCLQRPWSKSDGLFQLRVPYQVLQEFVEFTVVVETDEALKGSRKTNRRLGSAIFDLSPYAAAEWFYGLYSQRSNAPQRIEPRLTKNTLAITEKRGEILLLPHDPRIINPEAMANGELQRVVPNDGGIMNKSSKKKQPGHSGTVKTSRTGKTQSTSTKKTTKGKSRRGSSPSSNKATRTPSKKAKS